MGRRGVGVIAALIEILQKAGDENDPKSVEDLVLLLTRRFPERDPNGLLFTVRAQLSRLPKAGRIHLVKRRQDGVTLYLAYSL